MRPQYSIFMRRDGKAVIWLCPGFHNGLSVLKICNVPFKSRQLSQVAVRMGRAVMGNAPIPATPANQKFIKLSSSCLPWLPPTLALIGRGRGVMGAGD
jgi:hypothetical protein